MNSSVNEAIVLVCSVCDCVCELFVESGCYVAVVDDCFVIEVDCCVFRVSGFFVLKVVNGLPEDVCVGFVVPVT